MDITDNNDNKDIKDMNETPTVFTVKPIEAVTSNSVDVSFDIVLSSPSQSRSRFVAKPVSNASSSTSLNSFRSGDDSDAKSYGSTSMQSLDQIDSGNGRSNGYSSTSASTRSLNQPISDSDIKNINADADDIDYKKLCRQLLRENESLKRRIKELEEAEKKRDQDFGRERRSMQRTISEHEEELKTMAELKAENVKLKDDNAALIRVISKLSK